LRVPALAFTRAQFTGTIKQVSSRDPQFHRHVANWPAKVERQITGTSWKRATYISLAQILCPQSTDWEAKTMATDTNEFTDNLVRGLINDGRCKENVE
jgi:hypothetical protein